MNMQEILTLLRHNSNASDWGHIAQSNGVVSFCMEDVNLRLALLVTWENNKSFQTIEISYASTTVVSFSIPIGPALTVSDFSDSLGTAIGKTEELVSATSANSRNPWP